MENQRVAFITGANRGLGKETAIALARKGWHVFIGARNKQTGQELADSLTEEGHKASFTQIDISNLESIEQAAKSVSTEVDRLDVLINNAGVLIEPESSILETSIEALTDSFRINAIGPALVSTAFVDLLKQGDNARIVNVSSGAGQLCEVQSWAPAYSISKTALNAVTRQFASALGPYSISVNCACPGWCRTDMGGPNASRSAEEGVDTIVWLAAEAPQELSGMFFQDRAEIPW